MWRLLLGLAFSVAIGFYAWEQIGPYGHAELSASAERTLGRIIAEIHTGAGVRPVHTKVDGRDHLKVRVQLQRVPESHDEEWARSKVEAIAREEFLVPVDTFEFVVEDLPPDTPSFTLPKSN